VLNVDLEDPYTGLVEVVLNGTILGAFPVDSARLRFDLRGQTLRENGNRMVISFQRDVTLVDMAWEPAGDRPALPLTPGPLPD
jgi:hypothetical protein